MRSAFTHITPSDQLPWWWDDIRLDRQLCRLDYIQLKFRGKKSKQITTADLPFFLLTLLRELLVMRRKYDYVFTVECDFAGFGVALLQSLLFMKRPRHVILQFIMREKTTRLSSRLKYALMRFMFRSVHRVICSSRGTRKATPSSTIRRWTAPSTSDASSRPRWRRCSSKAREPSSPRSSAWRLTSTRTTLPTWKR